MSIHSKCGTDHPVGTNCPGVETLTIAGCARCHGDEHVDLRFFPFTHESTIDFNDIKVVSTHWANCPATNEPIIKARVIRNG